MKVLSLLQPWVSLAVMGIKTIETRNWQTAYRGELLIHASAGKRGALIADEKEIKKLIPHFADLPFGKIIGKVLLIDIVPMPLLQVDTYALEMRMLELNAFGEYTKKYGWIFSDAEKFETPIAAKGAIHLWEYPY